MRNKSLGILLAILFAISPMISWTLVAAKPVGVNPDFSSPAVGLIWGTNLRLENTYIGESWFGAGADDSDSQFPGPNDGYLVDIMVGGAAYSKYTIASLGRTAPGGGKEDNWYLRFRAFGDASSTATISSVMENADTLFVPQDYSVVLDNSAAGIFVNLRAENGTITGIGSVYATLYVDNAVNVSISPSSRTGNAGDNVSFTVTVQNTGRYQDTYSLSSTLGTLSPSSLTINAGNSGTATLNLSPPVGAADIAVTADGAYASDNCAASTFGVPVSVAIWPEENNGLPGEEVIFTVSVTNFGEACDNFNLTVSENENLNWKPKLDDNALQNVAAGENKETVLRVTIPENTENNAKDNITVIATSQTYPWASDTATCVARAGFYGVEVSILENYQENVPGGKLNYTIRVSNTGDLNDTYELTFADNINGDTYWEENISLDNSSLAVPAGENRTATLRVTIPDNAPPGTYDNITVTAASQADNTVKNSASCIAHVARLSISISPSYQSGLPGEELIYIVKITNNENTEGDYYSIVTDNFGWKLAFGIKRIILYPFGEAWTILKVTVPENAIGCTKDTVTVTMVSMDNTISYSASCIAHATVVRSVEVSVTPHENSGPPGATLEYTIIVKNTGNVDDNYDLTASDDAGWSLELSPSSLTVPLRSSENTKLDVTIPENAEPKITDNIVVTATSKANPSTSAENSCTAYSLALSKLHLLRGWNLIGFPLTSENTTPNNLFSGMSYTMYYWEAPYGPYIEPNKDQPVEDNLGYWVHVDENTTVTMTGIPPDSRAIYLVAGWNLAHFPLTSENTTPHNLFAGTTYTMYYWEAPYGPYIEPNNDQPVEDNLGYWVYLKENKTVTVPL